MMNYGDVALNLRPEWNRKLIHDKKFALWIVGHEGGKSDAALKDQPDKRHQFVFIDRRYKDELAMHLSNGFTIVDKDHWDINETLWQWDSENHVNNQGQTLYARPANLYFEQQTARERELNSRADKAKDADDEAREIALRAGIPYEEDDRPVRKARR